MRWTIRLSTLALLLAATAGCKQQCFVTECDYQHYRDKLAGFTEFDPQASQTPTSVVHTTGSSPTTVLDPNRRERYLSLAEALSIALEQGTRGPGIGTGQVDDTLVRFQAFGGPGGALFSDHIRVLALNPAVSQTNIEQSLSKFDAVFATSMNWSVTDTPIGTALQAFQAGRSGALNAIQTDAANFSSSVLKPLPTGGVAGITFNTQYQFTNLPARVNPAYTPTLQFQFEQPLLQGFGVEINELRQQHPGSILAGGNIGGIGGLAGLLNGLGGGSEGILITRVRFDQERAEFEASVNQMLLNVEVAYWNLYSAYWTLYSRELGLRLAYEYYRGLSARLQAGGASEDPNNPLRPADVARARGQYELFRSQRLEALGRVLEAERQLRGLLGLPVADDCRLVPSDTPTLSPYQPDWCTALQEAITLRPELVIARENLKVRQLDLINQRNLLLPDLRFTSTYDINSIGTSLSGPDSNNALRNLALNDFHNWSLGLRLVMPLGFRAAHSQVRRARLELARSYAVLKDQELKASRFLELQYRRLFELYQQMKTQRAQREAYGRQLRLEFERVRVGQTSISRSTAILEAQRFFSEALANEYNTIGQYNSALAAFEYAKGTLLHHNNVIIGEGPLPACAQEEAVKHFEKRTRALVLAERKHPVHCANDCGQGPGLPVLPAHGAVSLPALREGAPAVPQGMEPEGAPLPRSGPEANNLLPGEPVPMGNPTPASRLKVSSGIPSATGSQPLGSTPPARSQQFGAAQMLAPSVNSRDSAPTLMPGFLGSPGGQ
jgi:outer membrane protein TolC